MFTVEGKLLANNLRNVQKLYHIQYETTNNKENEGGKTV